MDVGAGEGRANLTPRIPVLDGFDEAQQAALSGALRDETGHVLNVFAVLAHHPLLLKRFNLLGGLFLAEGALPARDREIAILRTAWRIGSTYEFAQHVILGRQAGLRDSDIAAVQVPTAPHLSPADRVLVQTVDELVARDDLSESAWSALTSRYSSAQLLELIMLIGYYRMLAALLRTLRVPVEPHIEALTRSVLPQTWYAAGDSNPEPAD